MVNFRLVPDVHVTVPNGPALMPSLNALAREQIPFAGSVTAKRMTEFSARRIAMLLVLLGACAQPPIALPPPLAEDCGLSEQDREELERWERQMFEPIREIDARGEDALAGAELPPSSGQRCEAHGTALQILPAIAVPGLAANAITYVQEFDVVKTKAVATLREDFAVSAWEQFYGPQQISSARLFAPVGCYLRSAFVPVHACLTCRAEYRRWCRDYTALRPQHLLDFPARFEEWSRAYEAMLRDASQAMVASPP